MLLMVCDNAANGLLIMLRSPTKLGANTPPGVGADSSRPYPNIIKYTYSHYRIRIFVSHFVGVFIYAGAINRPLQLRTVCDNAADGLPNVSQRIANAWQIRICGHDKSAPYGCLWSAVMLLTNCQNTYNTNTKTLPLCTTLLLPIL